MPYVLAYAVSVSLTGGLASGRVAKWTGLRAPHPRPPHHRVLCSGLALLPGYGLVLGMVIMWLLVLRTTEADAWPDAVVMVAGSGVIWVVVQVTLFTLSF